MATLQEIALWKAHNNPLEHVLGGGSISPCILTTIQRLTSESIFVCEEIEEETNMRDEYLSVALRTRAYKGKPQAFEISPPTSSALTSVQKDSMVMENYYLSDKMKDYIRAKNEKWTGNNGGATINKKVGCAINTALAQRRCDASNYVSNDCEEECDIQEMDDNEYKKKRIRKLTERECFRLMGVKEEDFQNIVEEQAATKQYHMAGDSIVTTVLMAIFGEMLGVDYEKKIDEVIDDISRDYNG